MPTIVLTDWRAERDETASVTIEMPDGQPPIVFPPPERWPDFNPRDVDKAMRKILGDEQFDRWVAAGGTGKELDRIYTDASGGTSPGE